jgi:hypothetical protein
MLLLSKCRIIIRGRCEMDTNAGGDLRGSRAELTKNLADEDGFRKDVLDLVKDI